MSVFKNITIAAILAGGIACLAYAYRKWMLRPRNSNHESGKKAHTADDALTEVCQNFLMYADNFQGLYEPMYKVSVGSISQERMKNILMEWDIRMGNISNAPISLKSWWATMIAGYEDLPANELQKRATSIVQMIFTAGIVRDDRKDLVASQDTVMYYHNPEGIKWEKGQKLHVEAACWYMPCVPVRIIEKGFCEII